jgi:hypothetical protein
VNKEPEIMNHLHLDHKPDMNLLCYDFNNSSTRIKVLKGQNLADDVILEEAAEENKD